MPPIAKLTKAQRKQIPPAWELVEGRDAIARAFRFADFSAAFAFMTRVALLAEKHEHHPEWSNTYNRVDIVLSPHDARGLSKRDLDMALAIDRMIGNAPMGDAGS